MSSAERVDLPSGQSLVYVDEDHSYWRWNAKTGKRGRRLTGVTTVTRTLDHDPKNLLRWAAREQCQGVAELYALASGDPESLHWLSTRDSILRQLEDHALTFEDIRNRAAKRGTNVHQIAFQALGMGRPVPDLAALTPEEQGHAQGIMAFWLDFEPEPEQVEQIVYSERLGVAGRLDFRGRIKGYEGVGVIDAKTGRFISASAHAQVGGGYPLLAEESGFGPSEWALILKTSENGSYELIEAEAGPDDFEAAVAAYRAAGRINGAAAKARKATRTKRETDAQIAEMAGAS